MLGQGAEENQSGQRCRGQDGAILVVVPSPFCVRLGRRLTREVCGPWGHGEAGVAMLLGPAMGSMVEERGLERLGQVEEGSTVRRESGKGRGGCGHFRVSGRGCRPRSGAVVNHTFPETHSSVEGRGPAHTQFGRSRSRCCASPASSGPAVLSKLFPAGRGWLILPGPVCSQHGSPRVQHTEHAQEG